MTSNIASLACISTISSTPHQPHRPLKRRKRRNYRWQDEPFNTARGETALWVAVITQAMMDALSRATSAEATYHKHEAINWLTGNGKDFKLVCSLADLGPSDIRRKAKQALANPPAWRAEAGTSNRYQERKKYRQRRKQESNATAIPISIPVSTWEEVTTVITGPWK